MTFTNSLASFGSLTVGGKLETKGNATIDQTLEVKESVVVDENLSVQGNISNVMDGTFLGNLSANSIESRTYLSTPSVRIGGEQNTPINFYTEQATKLNWIIGKNTYENLAYIVSLNGNITLYLQPVIIKDESVMDTEVPIVAEWYFENAKLFVPLQEAIVSTVIGLTNGSDFGQLTIQSIKDGTGISIQIHPFKTWGSLQGTFYNNSTSWRAGAYYG